MNNQNNTFPVEKINDVKRRRGRKNIIRRAVIRVTVMLAVIATIVLVCSLVLFPVVKVSGSAVSSVYENGDIILLVKDFRARRGQFCCIKWQNKLLFKRIIAVGGDTVDIDANGNVFVNGVYLEEDYVVNRELGQCDIELPYQVPEGGLFVLSDIRSDCADSRCSEIGCITEEQILGVTVGKIWT